MRLELREGSEEPLTIEHFELLYGAHDSGILAPIVSVGFSRFVLLPQDDVTPLQNASLRSSIVPGEHVTAGGVAGAQGGWKLLRVVGPTLAEFGVVQPLAEPSFRVLRKDAEPLSVGDWRTDSVAAKSLQQISSLLGAFPLSETGADAACFTWIPPGPFLVHCVNSSAEAGDVLLEIYPLPSGL